MSRGRLLLALLCLGLHRLSWVSPWSSLPRRTRTPRRAEESQEEEALPAEAEPELTEDWRAFRARLVQQEGSEGSEESSEKDKWDAGIGLFSFFLVAVTAVESVWGLNSFLLTV